MNATVGSNVGDTFIEVTPQDLNICIDGRKLGTIDIVQTDCPKPGGLVVRRMSVGKIEASKDVTDVAATGMRVFPDVIELLGQWVMCS